MSCCILKYIIVLLVNYATIKLKNQTSLGEEHSIKYLTSSPQKQGESEKPSARRSLRRTDEQIQHAVGDGVLEQIQALSLIHI